MSGLSITVEDAALRRSLARLHTRLRDLRPALRSIGQTLVTATDLTFHEQRDPWGQPWAPLRPATLARRRTGKRAGAKQAAILRDSGRLAGSYSYRVGRQSVSVGSNVIYSAAHHRKIKRGEHGTTRRGVPIPWGDIPARAQLPIRDGRVDLPPALADDLLDALQARLEAV